MLDLKQALENFLQEIPFPALAQRISERCGTSPSEAIAFLDIYANETRVALSLVEAHLNAQSAILEVGAGLCLFSLFLKSRGYNITALEPTGGGFGKFLAGRAVIIEHFHDLDLEVLEYPAECLAHQARRYDLIFSNNVIEHIGNLRAAWDAMSNALAHNGLMIHNCPNYLIPYEPHLGIPVLKRIPALSRFFFPWAFIGHEELWDSINFIDYFDVLRLARHCGLAVSFRRGLLFDACNRLGGDTVFRERHSGSFIIPVYRFLKITGLLALIRYIPPMLSTPMIFECRK